MTPTAQVIMQIKEKRIEEIKNMDEKAERDIKLGIAAVVATAAIPAHVNWAATATAMGIMCVDIGACYGERLTDESGAKDLIKQFIYGAGFWFMAMHVGSKIFAAAVETTGIGYLLGASIDATVSGAFAYAIGKSAKLYFKQKALGKKVSAEEIGATTFRECFTEYKKAHSNN